MGKRQEVGSSRSQLRSAFHHLKTSNKRIHDEKPIAVKSTLRPSRTGRVRKVSTVGPAQGVRLAPSRKLLEEDFGEDSEAHAVNFEYFNPHACEVLVAGSFNDWRARATPMSKQPGGRWSTQILLEPGDYEYRFVVDGTWQDDPLATRFAPNPFGGLNCVVEVKATAVSAEARP
jgi:1,4-alpha-glucan branching enzyme